MTKIGYASSPIFQPRGLRHDCVLASRTGVRTLGVDPRDFSSSRTDDVQYLTYSKSRIKSQVPSPLSLQYIAKMERFAPTLSTMCFVHSLVARSFLFAKVILHLKLFHEICDNGEISIITKVNSPRHVPDAKTRRQAAVLGNRSASRS